MSVEAFHNAAKLSSATFKVELDGIHPRIQLGKLMDELRDNKISQEGHSVLEFLGLVNASKEANCLEQEIKVGAIVGLK